jgi:HAD superfamily hydrolase (TIGR01509 family)
MRAMPGQPPVTPTPRPSEGSAVEGVIFDLDGVLIDSEPVWEEVRRAFVTERGGRWEPDTQSRLMGMSTREWATYLSEELGVPMEPDALAGAVSERIEARFAEHLPLIDGAVDAVRRLAARWPCGLASSSPLPVILFVLDRAGIAASFSAVTSSDEVARGKPAPDVYLLAARRLGVEPARAVAVEDSSNGLRAAAAAGCTVVAVPRPAFPPDPDALALASVVLEGPGALHRLTPELVASLGSRT